MAKDYTLSEKADSIDPKKYPVLAKYTDPITEPKRKTLGRRNIIRLIEAFLDRPEYSNVILLGNAGAGKTAIVDELAREDQSRAYYEVDLDRMASSEGLNGGSGSVEMASRMKDMMKELIRYQQDHKKDIVIFMDEFHLIEEVSKAASQAIKPMLARSGELHIKLIAATTFDEFNQYIKKDAALSQRLQRITVNPPDRHTDLAILKSMKDAYVPNAVVAPGLFQRILDLTNKYIPSQSQPRKSILIFDAMIGAYRAWDTPLDERSLNKMLYATRGIRADWSVNVRKLRSYLNSRVLDQKDATYILAMRLYMSVAGTVDPHRPQGSFLFTGSTGVGKTEMAKAMTKALLGSEDKMIRFDMANYRLNSSLNQFRKELTTQVSEHSNWVILFDEVDKAGSAITRLLLPVLDEGELADANGRLVSFRNTYIIMTTNAAQSVYHEMENQGVTEENTGDGNVDASWVANFRKIIQNNLINGNNNFPTELVNRLDDFIPFKPLSLSTMRKIALKRLNEIKELFKNKFDIQVHYAGDDDTQYVGADNELHKFKPTPQQPTNPNPYQCGVLDYVVDEHMSTDTNSGGARGVKRVIDQEITSRMSELYCMDPSIRGISVWVQDAKLMRLNNHASSVGKAYIKVSPYEPTYHHRQLPNSRISRDEVEQEGAL